MTTCLTVCNSLITYHFLPLDCKLLKGRGPVLLISVSPKAWPTVSIQYIIAKTKKEWMNEWHYNWVALGDCVFPHDDAEPQAGRSVGRNTILWLWATFESWERTETVPVQRWCLNYSHWKQTAEKMYGHQGAPKSNTHKGPLGFWPVFPLWKFYFSPNLGD